MTLRGKAFTCSSGLLLLFLFFTLDLLQQSCAAEACAPSSCGEISNISYPFRLKDDPPNCGHPSYELACVNNVTLMLPLDSGKYKVLAINYDNLTVRVVDAGLQEGNCSSFPRYSVSASFVRNDGYPYTYDRFNPDEPYGQADNVSYITYLNCSNPVRDDFQYMNTSACVNWHSQGHFYAIAGYSNVADLKSQCEVKLVTAMTWDQSWNNKRFTYAEIHKIAVYGFEVSWISRACEDQCRESHSYSCDFDRATHILQCKYYLFGPTKCGIMSKLCILAQGYAIGFMRGIFQIIEEKPLSFIPITQASHNFDDLLFILATDAGLATDNFVLPYISVRFLLGTGCLFVLLIYTCRRRHISMYENIEEFLQGNNLIPIRYSYKEIKKMTRGFKDKLGEGGYGSVYKGKLRSGPFVAIKLLGKSKANGQEFISEVATIGRIHHANVVTLVGYCVEGSKRALVYEFMPNGSLDKYIFSKEGSISLSYEKMYEISLGVAHGITYLHQVCDMQILHFDVKPHNILLDDNFIPKVSDFGLAKLYPVDDSIVTLTAARGTLGYMAPELFYNNIGGVSYKADVYSFGMLLMEMASRRKSLNPHAEHSSQFYFPFWIHDQFSEGKEIEMEDVIEEEKNDVVKKMFLVALWCIQLKPRDRPSMNKIVEMLEGDVESLEMPPKPSLYPHERIVEDMEVNSDTIVSNDSADSTNHIGEGTSGPLLKNSA